MAVLYSPFGSPDLYQQSPLMTYKDGVNFNETAIANAGHIPVRGASNYSQGIVIPGTDQKNKLSYHYSTSAYSDSQAGNGNEGYSFATGKTAGGAGESSDGLEFAPLASSERDKKAGNSGSLLTGTQYLSLSSDVNQTLAPTVVPFQGTTPSNPLGTTDPGGDPTGNPIPVGDGWLFLISLAVVYGVIKIKFLHRH